MGELAQTFLDTLAQSVASPYNVAYAVTLALLLTKLTAEPRRVAKTLLVRTAVALAMVWLLGTISDVIFPNTITWTLLPALACGVAFRDFRLPARVSRLALTMCSWMYSLAVAEVVNRFVNGGTLLAAEVSLIYMAALLAILQLLERGSSLDKGDVSPLFVVPILVVCVSGLLGRAILILRSDFGMEPYSVSTLESILTCLNGQVAELVVYGAILRLVREMADKERLVAERHLAESRLESLQAYRESGESLRKLRHEVKNQYAYIRLLLEQKDYARAERFFGEMSMHANPTFQMVSSGNDLVDDIVNLEVSKARAAGVEVSSRIAVPPELPVEEVDLCSLLMNLLDNAIEACEGLGSGAAEQDTPGEKTVRLSIVSDQGTLLVSVTNPACRAPKLNDRGLPVTTKAERGSHGYGTSIVRSLAEKYHGVADFSYEDGSFVAKVMLALPA